LIIAQRKAILAAVAFLVLLAVIFLLALPEACGQIPANTVPPESPASEAAEESPPEAGTPLQPDEAAPDSEQTPVASQAPGDIPLGARQADRPLGEDSASADSSFMNVTLELFLYLGAIVVLIVLILVFFKRIIPGSHRLFQSKVVEVLGRTYLAPKQGLFLVKLADRILVLGVTGNSINVLSEITEEEEVAKIRELTGRSRPESITSAFRSIFSRKRRDFDEALSDNMTGDGTQRELGKIKSMISNWKERYSEGPAGT
jgi:flagellar biogenesis protein FliO